LLYISQAFDIQSGFGTGFFVDSIVNQESLNYAAPYVALVSDNALMGPTGGIYGRRYRFAAEAVRGSVRWMNYNVDVRRYDALIFSYLTFATRFAANLSVGPDEREFPKYIGRPDFFRGYDREQFAGADCGVSNSDPSQCSAVQLLGSRVMYANAELRFPLVRRVDLGILPISLPPVDGLFFYDMGVAWSNQQNLWLTRPANYDFATDRYPLRSYGFGVRMNLFNIALIRWDYSIPLDSQNKKGYWFWTLGQSF
jgi:outer membrane protein assembly factor BamA